MARKKITTNKTTGEVLEIIRNIPLQLSGRKRDQHGIASTFWGTLAHYMFTKIYESFEIRSEGGTDELGNKFKRLKESTVINRPIKPGELKGLGVTQLGGRGLLTPSENMKWKGIFFNRMKYLMKMGWGEEDAKEAAAMHAWAKIKEMGGKTKKQELAGRDVLIMRVTDRLFESFRPATLRGDGTYFPRKDQLYEWTRDKMDIGTLVEYAEHATKNRAIIPRNADKWAREGIKVAMEAAMQKAERLIR